MNKKELIARVWSHAEAAAAELGLTLWDVRYEKEGASFFLRILVDREGGAGIDDCEAMSRKVDPVLDADASIPKTYDYFEVWSAGMDRELVRDFHFLSNIGSKVTVGLFEPLNGEKEPVCTLKFYQDKTITVIDPAGEERTFALSSLRFVKKKDDLPF